jgi:phosphatidylglycerophosphatase A
MAKSYSVNVATAFPRQASPWERLQHIVSIGGPIGWIPWVPATCASAVTAAVCWWAPPSPATVVLLAIAIYCIGVGTATTSERLLSAEDPRNVVIDEIVGQLLTFLLVAPVSWRLALTGFVLFRAFDIGKPFPAGVAERLPGGWGIMTDDVVAGVYSAMALALLRRFILPG